MDFLAYLIVAVISYFVGSIPTGYLVGRARGLDIRSVGSGNIGATNVLRVLGKGAGALVFMVDAVKGFAAAWFAPHIAGFFGQVRPGDPDQRDYLSILAAFCVILGHNYTCWLKFKGGKGVATSAGALTALFPAALVVVLAIWLIILALFRYVSLASIIAALALPLSAWLLHCNRRMMVVAFFMGGLVVYKHKANIKRLLNGTENRIDGGAPSGETSK